MKVCVNYCCNILTNEIELDTKTHKASEETEHVVISRTG